MSAHAKPNPVESLTKKLKIGKLLHEDTRYAETTFSHADNEAIRMTEESAKMRAREGQIPGYARVELRGAVDVLTSNGPTPRDVVTVAIYELASK